MNNTVAKENEVCVDAEEYAQLLKDQQWLSCLEAAGVDNWDGYSYAYDLLEEQNEDED